MVSIVGGDRFGCNSNPVRPDILKKFEFLSQAIPTIIPVVKIGLQQQSTIPYLHAEDPIISSARKRRQLEFSAKPGLGAQILNGLNVQPQLDLSPETGHHRKTSPSVYPRKACEPHLPNCYRRLKDQTISSPLPEENRI